jgi:hypothetical protein
MASDDPYLRAAPRSTRDDELLAVLPPSDYNRGRLAGYDAGRRARVALLVSLGVLLLATTVGWYFYATREPAPAPAASRQYQLPPGTDISARPRVLTWSQGKARLGLSREPPGVDTVELPDRTLRLAPGADMAQFKVLVEDGKTTALEVVSGEAVEELKPGAAPLLPR